MTHSDKGGHNHAKHLRAGTLAVCLLGLTVSAEALIRFDQCGGPPSEMAQYSCPPGDYYLLRPRFTDGTCGDWVCCPKNVGGPESGYNCEQGVPPTRSAVSGTLKKFLGPRVTIQGLTLTPGTTRPVPGKLQRRGVEGEPPTSSEKEGK